MRAVAGEQAVIKYHDIAFSGLTFFDHNRFMALTESAHGFETLQRPNNITAFFIDNDKFIEVTRVIQNIARLETFVAGVIPLVGRNNGNSIAVRPVSHTGKRHIAIEIKMLGGVP